MVLLWGFENLCRRKWFAYSAELKLGQSVNTPRIPHIPPRDRTPFQGGHWYIY